jgi:hypothetical protein
VSTYAGVTSTARLLVTKRIKYSEGDVFAVPLDHPGGYGLGVIARAKGNGPALGYFFGPRRHEVPDLADVADLAVVDNVLVAKFGDLGLNRGRWPIIGALPDWRREAWPMPAFGRDELLSDRLWRVEYADDDPNSRPREFAITRGEFEQLPKDGLAGYGFIEERLTGLLGD